MAGPRLYNIPSGRLIESYNIQYYRYKEKKPKILNDLKMLYSNTSFWSFFYNPNNPRSYVLKSMRVYKYK